MKGENRRTIKKKPILDMMIGGWKDELDVAGEVIGKALRSSKSQELEFAEKLQSFENSETVKVKL